MDEQIKPLLQEIASELRARNDLIREQQRRAEQVRSEMLSNLPFGPALSNLETGADSPSSRLWSHEDMLEGIKEDAERDRSERHEFQQALLAEIRRLNQNLEALLEKRG